MLRSTTTPNRTLGAAEAQMQQQTIRPRQPVLVAPAAEIVTLSGGRKPADKLTNIRLFRA
jgi:hypothetical protein